jgi:ankyrin repeat protein
MTRFKLSNVRVVRASEGRLTEEMKKEIKKEKLFCACFVADVLEHSFAKGGQSRQRDNLNPGMFNVVVLQAYSGRLTGTILKDDEIQMGENCPRDWDDICPFTCEEYKAQVVQLRNDRKKAIAAEEAAQRREEARKREQLERQRQEEAKREEEERNRRAEEARRKAEEIAERDRLLWEAVNKGELQKVHELLNKGANLDSRDPEGMTPLMIATRSDKRELVELLLSKESNINFVGPYGDSALLVAAMNGRSELVTFLLEKGASPDARNSDGQTALMLAYLTGNMEKVKTLLQLGADVEESKIQSPLRLAGVQDNLKMLELMVDNCKVKISKEILSDMLMGTIPKGRVETIKLLIKKGADPDATVPPGRFPTQFALMANRLEIFEELLTSGADPNKLIPLWTPTLIKKTEFMKILLSHAEKLSPVEAG